MKYGYRNIKNVNFVFLCLSYTALIEWSLKLYERSNHCILQIKNVPFKGLFSL